MADQSRQNKLAAAKKKLKEFQQKSAPPSGGSSVKKKRKTKEAGQLDTPQGDRHSPDNIQSILKVLVSDLSVTNGVALPPFVNSQAVIDGEARASPGAQAEDDQHGEPMRGSPVPNPASAINPESRSESSAAQSSSPDANCNENSQEENRPLSSTESLRQLSQQLNGLLSESPSSYVNGDSAASPPSEKELESRNQELSAALDSSKLTNTQLSTQLDQLTHQSQQLSEQLQKERKEFEQKCMKEQGAMREQLQVHIQTIGILVSEKSELQTALAYTQQAARQKTGEAEELNNRFQAAKQRVSELERTLSSVSTQQKQFEKHNKELEKERDSLKLDVYRLNKGSEEMKQQGSELAEQLKLRVSENSAMSYELDDLRKRLEMADLMIQQFSSQSGPPSSNQQAQLLLEEKLQLEAHTAQLMESVAQLQVERDQYAVQIQEEGRVWKEKTEQLLTQVTSVSEERDSCTVRIQELESHISELKSAAALLAQEAEALAPAPPTGPSEAELGLQQALSDLQQERDSLSAQYQAQVRDNEQLSRLVQEQEARLLELQQEAHRGAEEAQDRHQLLEDAQSDKATISRALAQNRQLKEQLAELQNGFVKLTNENMELTSGLQSEQHVKKELARKMGQLQEDLHNIKEQLEQKVEEVHSVQEQRDQYLAHLQQYTGGYQQLVSEREELHRHFLQQTQLMDRLQHDEVQGKVQLEQSQLQLEQAQAKLNQLAKDNEELKTEVQELLNSSALGTPSRDQGDGLEEKSMEESFPTSNGLSIPEDFDSREQMEEVLHSALSHLEQERDEVSRQLEEERRLHQASLQQVALLSPEHQHHSTCTDTGPPGSDSVPAEVHEALRVAMEKLQQRFTTLMQEKADLRERVEELEHRCIQLSGETDTIGEYIALYQNQRAIMKQRHLEKEEYISMLAKDKEEMKVKLAELQDLVMRLVGERNEWYSKYVSSVNNPDLLAASVESALPAQRRMELNAVDGPESMEVGSELGAMGPAVVGGSDVEPELQEECEAGLESLGVVQRSPVEDGTARQIMQLLQEIQNPQSRPASFLGESPCIPFFYRPDEHDEVKILVV
ncbi:golgin subfamily A member 2 isoform X2 [Conger conger]|uniref:golgin subfamily A member 2 isoform X2 n=1 Tax=Conger conger TaxID=82655 RepID=UPI002A59A937|nr:golgin subfamily A member 2 isoform X2 [Conger conger]